MEAQTAIGIRPSRLPGLHLDPDVRIPCLPNLLHRGPTTLPASRD